MPAEKCERCGGLVSENKRYCFNCVRQMAIDAVNAREERPMDGATHIICFYQGTRPDQRATYKAEDLYRRDGLFIASRQGDLVRYGDDISTARNHVFRTEEDASRFLARVADIDLICQRDCVFIHERIYIYANEEKCPRLAVIDRIDEGTKNIFAEDGRKITLATPGQMHRLY
jgi:hypothetical protein